MKKEYLLKLKTLVDDLHEKAQRLLKSTNMDDVQIASDISYLKGYIEVLEYEK